MRIALLIVGLMLGGFFPRPGWSAIPPKSGAGTYAEHFPETHKKIRVRLSESAADVSFRGFDLKISDRRGNLLSEPDGSTEWKANCAIAGTVSFARSDSRAIRETAEPLVVESPTGFIRYKGLPYRERLLIYSTGKSCEVVNVLDIEKYLDGLVNAEFSAKWNEEAIEAQVVAARTYAYYQMLNMRKNTKSHYDLDATVKDQVYDGSIREDYRASRGVENTRGMILTAAFGRMPSGIVPTPIKAFYHSTCGGKTLTPEKVWGGTFPGFKRGVACPFCAVSPVFNWKTDLTANDLWTVLTSGRKKSGKLPGWPTEFDAVLYSGRLVDLRVGQLDPDGRIQRIDTGWIMGNGIQKTLSLSGARFREWVGATKIKSTWFSIIPASPYGGTWRIVGKGNGHGVGMCQWGAKVMGEKGYKSASILKQYYPDADLKRAW